MTNYFVGDVLIIKNDITEKQFEILDLADGVIHLFDSVLGIKSSEKLNKISELILLGKAKVVPRNSENRKFTNPLSSDFASYPDAIKSETRRRFQYVSEVIKENPSIYTVDTLAPVIKSVSLSLDDQVPPSIRTLCRWIKKFNENGRNIKALIPSHRDKGNKKAKIDPKVEPYISRAIEAYKKTEKPSVSAVYKDLEMWINYDNSISAGEKIKVPSLVTLTKRIEETASFELYAARNGKRLANVEFRQNQLAPKTSFILQRAEIDHTPLDIFVVDAQNRMLLGRPLITSIIDKHSRCVLGCHIGFEPPSYLSVSKALRNAILPKDVILSKYPKIQNDWPCHGIPSVLVTDRGKEFESQAFEDACMDLNVSIQKSPAKHPWYKGAIESHFKTINQRLLSGMPGSVLSKVQQVADYDPAKNGVMSLDAFLEAFYLWLVDIYHQSATASGTVIPMLVWKQNSEIVPIKAIEPERLDLILAENKEVSLTRSGIKIDYLTYDSEELLKYRMRYGSRKVLIKYDRENLGSIAVLNEAENQYFSVPAIHQKYAQGLTLYQL
jgi:putative transposase